MSEKFVINSILTVAVAVALWATIRRFPPASWSAMQLLGLILLCVGFVLWSVARFHLGTAITVSARASKLVSHGIYSRIRNPIYLFGSCTLAGLALTLGRPVWLLGFVVVIPLQIWRAAKEAAVLESAFGDDYRRYRAGTWF
jgi:protein-S-isoprenylcysteine O-methyltransferase Ste14